MNLDKTYASLNGALMDYFGKKKDQDLKSFQEELRALTESQRAVLRRELVALGYRIAA
jgi:hypothetical protein